MQPLGAQERGNEEPLSHLITQGSLPPAPCSVNKDPRPWNSVPLKDKVNSVVFKLTFYLEITSNLQNSYKNRTKNLHIALTQTHPVLTFVPSALSPTPLYRHTQREFVFLSHFRANTSRTSF